MDDLQTCAHHEAGHAIIARILGIPVYGILLEKDRGCDDWSGQVMLCPSVRADQDGTVMTRICFAGAMAEARFRTCGHGGRPRHLDPKSPVTGPTLDLILQIWKSGDTKVLSNSSMEFRFRFEQNAEEPISVNGIVSDLLRLRDLKIIPNDGDGGLETALQWLAEKLNEPSVWDALAALAKYIVERRGNTIGLTKEDVDQICAAVGHTRAQ